LPVLNVSDDCGYGCDDLTLKGQSGLITLIQRCRGRLSGPYQLEQNLQSDRYFFGRRSMIINQVIVMVLLRLPTVGASVFFGLILYGLVFQCYDTVGWVM